MHRFHAPKLRLASLLLGATVCLALASPVHAQWKWRDGRGQVHVSDIPPPRDIPDKDVLQRPEPTVRKPAAAPVAASAPAAAAGKAPVDPELEERRKRAEQEQAARGKAEDQKSATIRRDNCQRARDHLATLESGQRIARVKADGEREILDDDARAKESKRARDIIASDCR